MKTKEREDKRAKHVVDFFTPSKKTTQQVTKKKRCKSKFQCSLHTLT